MILLAVFSGNETKAERLNLGRFEITSERLVFGKKGTAKSLLSRNFFGAFTGSDLCSIEFTGFTTESDVFGVPNTQIMRDEGRIWRNPEGTILRAHFGEFDEFLDGSAPLVRIFLGLLNERIYRRGSQIEKAPLHTVLASTNINPDEAIKRTSGLDAVLDRFLFQTEVNYLQTAENRRRMYASNIYGRKDSICIPYDRILSLANAVSSVRVNEAFIDLHERLVEEFQKAVNLKFSDRRKCQALRLAQANARLFGKNVVSPDDFMAIAWAFCKGNDHKGQELFKKTATPLIDEAIKGLGSDEVEVQKSFIKSLENNIREHIGKDLSAISANAEALIKVRRALNDLYKEIEAIKPLSVTVDDQKKRLLRQIDDKNREVQKIIDGEGGE